MTAQKTHLPLAVNVTRRKLNVALWTTLTGLLGTVSTQLQDSFLVHLKGSEMGGRLVPLASQTRCRDTPSEAEAKKQLL